MKPKGRKNLSDKLSRKPKTDRASRPNPFELFLTKAKHNVAGRSTNNAKNAAVLSKLQGKGVKGGKKSGVQIQAQGLRSVARSTALQNRKKGLLNEYKTRTKNNHMVDKRLGERDTTMSLDDKMLERVMFERKKSAKAKRGLFNLNDNADQVDEELAFGQSLAEVERLEDEDGKPEVDEMEEEQLGEKFVAEHHFGGGLLKKVPAREHEIPISRMNREERKQLVDDIIAESKQKKYAKQSELDEVRDMTESLDAKWGDVEVRKLISATFNQAVPEPQVENYDSLVKMLQFEKKGKGTDKLRNESEIAKDEKDALDKLEKKRQKAEKVENPAPKLSVESSSREIEMLEPEIEDIDDDSAEVKSESEEADAKVLLSATNNDSEKYPDIPFVIEMPDDQSGLEVLLGNRNPEACLVVISRIMRYYHISLAEENRAKLSTFFGLLFDFMLDKAESAAVSSLEFWNILTPLLHELFTIANAKGVELVKNRLEILGSLISGPKRFVLVPSALIFLKFVSVCFPPTIGDPITETVFLLMGKLLVRLTLSGRQSFLQATFVSSMAAEYCKATKRYFPELFNHFKRIVSLETSSKLSLPSWTSSKISVTEVFAASAKEAISFDDRSRCLNLTIELIKLMVEPLAELPAYSEIFGELCASLLKLCENAGELPELSARCDELGELVAVARRPRPYSTFFKKKPAPLKLLEPRFENKFEKAKSAKKSEIKRLLHDKKRAVKGAKRELRRDNQFISRIQMEEQAKKDVIRRKKVKEIYTGLYTQQSEHKAFQRQKAKFKM